MARAFDNEDGPEDVAATGHQNAECLKPYEHQQHQGTRCPGDIRARLDVLRAELQGRAEVLRRRGASL